MDLTLNCLDLVSYGCKFVRLDMPEKTSTKKAMSPEDDQDKKAAKVLLPGANSSVPKAKEKRR